jgi:hypothetical protein
MKGLRLTSIWIFLAMGASFVIGQRQRQGTSMPPIQQAPSSPRSNFPSMGGMGPMNAGDPSGTPDVLSSRVAEQQARSRNSERQKRLELDTDKLVGLVNELKQQVEDEKKLSPADVSKRAEEIEKLARSVKDRMKG